MIVRVFVVRLMLLSVALSFTVLYSLIVIRIVGMDVLDLAYGPTAVNFIKIVFIGIITSIAIGFYVWAVKSFINPGLMAEQDEAEHD